MAKKLSVLLAVPLFLGTFAASYFTLSPATAVARVRGALPTVMEDPARVVCLGSAPCVDEGAAYDLFVFFSRKDCAIGLYQMAVLEEVYRAVPRAHLNVVGVAVGGDLDRGAAEQLARVSGISYPLYLDPGQMDKHFGRVRPVGANKPVMVLVDRSGHVVHMATAGGTVAELQGLARQMAARAGGRAP